MINVNFEFRHNNLSLIELHAIGIRHTKDIEETILGDSYWEIIEDNENHLYFATGFSKNVIGIVVAFTINEAMVITTLQAKRASIYEIKKYFCKYCK